MHPILVKSQAYQQSRLFIPKLSRHIRVHGLAWLLLLVVLMLVQANYRLAVNRTPSLPYSVFLICLNDQVETGGLVAFRWHHGKPYPDGMVFIKRLLASPGDPVIKSGRDFQVGQTLLYGKTVGMTGRKLSPNNQLQEGLNTIPLGQYFVAGDHEYSLDSRYSLLGLVDQKDIIGRAYPIF